MLDWLAKTAQTQLKRTSLKGRLAQDPDYRFTSAQEVAQAAQLGVRLDPNLATVDDWLRLPGLSIHQARLLVDLARGGVGFHCLEDIAAALNLPLQRLEPLAPVLHFCYYDPDSAIAPAQVNPNTATPEDLQRLPGIDGFLALTLVRQRRSGPYRDIADVQQRLKLSPEVVAQLMHYFTF
jgi:DNA uptake protein ComE-like DNA-binding protein